MSDASRFGEGDARSLTEPEKLLLETLLDMVPEATALRDELAEAKVRTMADGGMGSLRFTGSTNQRMGREAVAAMSVDGDGVPLEISLNLDEEGHLFELDIWKVNFSPLLRLPLPSQVTRA